jgi:predicted nucleotidyltransferase
MTEMENRQAFSQKRFKALQEKLKETIHLLGDKGCIYATGSYGREEASSHSDLDAFIVVKTQEKKRLLTNVDEILTKADLIKQCQALKFPEFDKDGAFLKAFTEEELRENIGTPEDDSSNTFTARLLLLLESKPILGQEFHTKLSTEVLKKYWRDYEGHKKDFEPTFLLNDILRLWRTFCVNYESSTLGKSEEKRKLKNYKLKHSRLMTCFSSLSYLLVVHGEKNTVGIEDVLEMTQQTPIGRLERIKKMRTGCTLLVEEVLGIYDSFLETTKVSENELLDKIRKGELDSTTASALGDKMSDLLGELGKKSPKLHRMLVV